MPTCTSRALSKVKYVPAQPHSSAAATIIQRMFLIVFEAILDFQANDFPALMELMEHLG